MFTLDGNCQCGVIEVRVGSGKLRVAACYRSPSEVESNMFLSRELPTILEKLDGDHDSLFTGDINLDLLNDSTR